MVLIAGTTVLANQYSASTLVVQFPAAHSWGQLPTSCASAAACSRLLLRNDSLNNPARYDMHSRLKAKEIQMS
jgi:hypothetical protein